jgi:hypothetical protein
MGERSWPRCEFRKMEEIREIAEEFRKTFWKTGSVPVDMEQIVEQGLVLAIIPVRGIRDLNKIDAYLTSNMRGIVVDILQYMDPQDRWANRLRFSFAHEVGHFVLHKHIYSTFNVESPEEYLEFVMDFPEEEYRSFEWQANEFAGSLLVPRDRLFEEIDRCRGIMEEVGLAKMWDDNREQVLVRMSPTLSRAFGVSDDVIERRISAERDVWMVNY